jgi:hypothetical protein
MGETEGIMAEQYQSKTGALPFMPQMNNTTPPVSGSGSRLVSDVQRSFAEGAQLQAFYAAMGMHPPGATPPPAKQEERTSTSVDLGSVIKALGDQNTAMMSNVLQLAQGSKAGAADPFLQYMMTELKEMRQQLIQAQQHPQQKDPMVVMTEYVDRYAGLMDRFKKDLNLPANMALGANNEGVAIQLKNLDLQQRQRELEWQATMHQWDVDREDRKEDRGLQRERFQMEHQLKVRELDEAAKKSSDTAGWMQDLAAVIVGAVEQKAPLNVGAQVVQQQPEEPREFRAKAFTCKSGTPMCGARVPLQQGAVEAQCPQCGMIYDLVPPQNQPPQVEDYVPGEDDLPQEEVLGQHLMAP